MIERYHIYPLDDSVGHELEGDECVCGPRFELAEDESGQDVWLIIHHVLGGIT